MKAGPPSPPPVELRTPDHVTIRLHQCGVGLLVIGLSGLGCLATGVADSEFSTNKSVYFHVLVFSFEFAMV